MELFQTKGGYRCENQEVVSDPTQDWEILLGRTSGAWLMETGIWAVKKWTSVTQEAGNCAVDK